MKLTIDRTIPNDISNVHELGKLFTKRYATEQYCSLLKHYIDNSKSECKFRRISKRISMNRFWKRNKSRDGKEIREKQVEKIKTEIIKENKNRNEGKGRDKEITKVDLKKTLVNPLPNIPEYTSRCRTSRQVRQQKQYICHSKKGRLLEPNKHSVVADSNVFVIAEGSGKFGDQIAGFISEFLLKSTKYLFSLEQFKNSNAERFNMDKLKEYFKQMFESANFELSLSNIDIRRSGCIVSIVYMHQGKIVTVSTKQPNVLLINKTQSRILQHPKNDKNINIDTSFLANQHQIRQRPVSRRKHIKQQQHFEGFGNIYSENCTCPFEVSIHSNISCEFVMLGSQSLFNYMKSFEIAETINSIIGNSLAIKVKELAQFTSKRMKTINHDDISCILIKCSTYK